MLVSDLKHSQCVRSRANFEGSREERVACFLSCFADLGETGHIPAALWDMGFSQGRDLALGGPSLISCSVAFFFSLWPCPAGFILGPFKRSASVSFGLGTADAGSAGGCMVVWRGILAFDEVIRRSVAFL